TRRSSDLSSDSRMAVSSSMIRMVPAAVLSTGARLNTATSDIDSLSNQRKFKAEDRALPGRAFHPDLSRVFLNNPVCYGQTQPRPPCLALPRRCLGGEERVVNFLDVLRRNARSCIANIHFHVGPV